MTFDRLLLYLGGIALLVSLALMQTCGPPTAPAVAVGPMPQTGPRGPRPGSLGFQRGMVFGVFPYRGEQLDYSADFAGMRAYGVDSVSLNYNWYTPTIRAPRVIGGVGDENHQTPSDAFLTRTIRTARQAGLRVMLFPSIFVLKLGEGEWRGKIAPSEGWAVWFDSYRALMLRTARLAQAEAVETLCVGVELISSEPQTRQWRRLIADVRRVYDGQLLYSSNWDARNDNAWFADLDYLGLNAYYELSQAKNPTLAELMRAWDRVRTEIAPWRARHKKPFIITEIGYCSTDGTIARPWNYFITGEIDLAEQALAYEAFFRRWADDPELSGAYVYHWYGAGGPEDGGYSPHKKPAGEVLRRWYRWIAAHRTAPVAPAGTATQPATRPVAPADADPGARGNAPPAGNGAR